MKTTFKKTLILITMLSVSVNAFANSVFQVDNLFYEIQEYDNVIVSGCAASLSYGDVVIPGQVSYNGKTYIVRGIGIHAFYKEKITSVKIPDTVNYIGQGAFFYCTGLTSIAIPEGVSSIGYNAFSYCENLESVTIPNSMKHIVENAFFMCENIKAVYTSDLSSWCKITFGDEYANPLFYSGNLYINGSLVNDIIIPNDITEIKNYTFYNCDNLTSVSMQNNVTSIGEFAFASCTNIAYVKIPDSVTSIGESAFKNCNNLESVKIPNRVTHLNQSTFHNCSSLTTLTLGVEVNTIERYTFVNCDNLTDITSLNPEPPQFDNDYHTPIISTFFSYIADKATLYVPKEALKSYMNSDVWKEFRKIKAIKYGNVRDVADDAVSVSAKEGNIVVSGTGNAVIEVYNLSGQLVYSGTDNVINLPSKGIYIVRVSGQTFKVIL